jgi:hypothetical protein
MMIFGGLSDEELQKIKAILDQEGIPYKIGLDQGILEVNQSSIKNDHRHNYSPNISNHILAIEINDDVFSHLSPSGKEKLLVFGITELPPPSEEDFKMPQTKNEAPEKYLTVHNLVMTIIIIISCVGSLVIIYTIYKQYFS